MPWARAVGVRTFGRAYLRLRGDCQNTASRAARGGEHQLGAVLPGPLHNQIARRTAAPARPQRETFDDHCIRWPLVEADRVAVQPLDHINSPVRRSR